MISANRPVRTRMPGGVGAGGENPPATRLEYLLLLAIHKLFFDIAFCDINYFMMVPCVYDIFAVVFIRFWTMIKLVSVNERKIMFFTNRLII